MGDVGKQGSLRHPWVLESEASESSEEDAVVEREECKNARQSGQPHPALRICSLVIRFSVPSTAS